MTRRQTPIKILVSKKEKKIVGVIYFLGAISLGRPKIFTNLLNTYKKLHGNGEPYCSEVQTDRQTSCYFITKIIVSLNPCLFGKLVNLRK